MQIRFLTQQVFSLRPAAPQGERLVIIGAHSD